jgi:hypothetical protein
VPVTTLPLACNTLMASLPPPVGKQVGHAGQPACHTVKRTLRGAETVTESSAGVTALASTGRSGQPSTTPASPVGTVTSAACPAAASVTHAGLDDGDTDAAGDAGTGDGVEDHDAARLALREGAAVPLALRDGRDVSLGVAVLDGEGVPDVDGVPVGEAEAEGVMDTDTLSDALALLLQLRDWDVVGEKGVSVAEGEMEGDDDRDGVLDGVADGVADLQAVGQVAVVMGKAMLSL